MSEQKRFDALNQVDKQIILTMIDYLQTREVGAILGEDTFKICTMAGITPALIDPALKKLVRYRFFNYSFDEDSSEYWYTIHEDFYEEAVPFFLAKNPDSSVIPAADRFVSTKDNQPEIDLAIQKLDELKDRIQNSNELRANPEERLALSQEVTALQTALKEPIVRLSSVLNAVNNGILSYLSTHVEDALLNALATAVVDHILKAFGLS
jgi:hypothetical protein